jgi:soluble lytic murein transglycosylase-like protein
VSAELAAWVLAAMVSLEASPPWAGTYAETAEAIADVALEAPLFDGEAGPLRTAALLTSLAWFESRFDPRAVGDHGRSVCLLQVHASNHAALGVTRDELLDDPRTCLRAGVKMIRQSFAVCARRPLLERLSHYAAGGAGCERGRRESRHRVGLAIRLVTRAR